MSETNSALPDDPVRFSNETMRRDYERRRALLFVGVIIGNLMLVSFVLVPLNRLGYLESHYYYFGASLLASIIWGRFQWKRWDPNSEQLNEPAEAAEATPTSPESAAS